MSITLDGSLGITTPAVNSTAYSGNASNALVTATGTTTPRTLQDRFADVVNVKDFGAVGNGSTNDRAAIVNAAATNKTLLFPPGSYSIQTNLTITNPCIFVTGAKIRPGAGVTITIDNVQSDDNDWVEGPGTVRSFTLYRGGGATNSFGYSPQVKDFARNKSIKRNISATDTNIAPMISMECTYTGNSSVQFDFPGAPGGTIPVGLYVQHEQIGTNSNNNAFTHSIMGLANLSAVGDNDVIAVTGRVHKNNIIGGIGDAGGVWGSAYQLSQQNGGVMAVEGAIYQNVTGSPSGDRLGPKWSTSFHGVSISTDSPATAGLSLDGAGDIGLFGYWNGILIDRSCFHGNGLTGTVGINCGSWNESYAPQYGIKFGSAFAHIYSTKNLSMLALSSIYIDTNNSNTSIFNDLGTGTGSNFVIRSGATGTPNTTRLVVQGSNGDVGINTIPNVNWSGGDAKLHVKGDDGDLFVGLLEGSGTQYTPTLAIKPIDASGSNQRTPTIQIHNENNIAVISQYFDLKTTGEAIIEFSTTTAGSRSSDRRGLYGRINSSGFVNVSDYRIKTNVQPLSSTLTDLCQLRPVSYKPKANQGDAPSNKLLHGFIAHEVQEIPAFAFAVDGEKDAVKENGEPEIQSLSYTLLIPSLVKGIQELKSIVDVQAQTIASLESRLANVEAGS